MARNWRGHGSEQHYSHEVQVEVCICYLAGVPIKDITERYGMSRSKINTTVRNFGIEADRGKRRPA